MRPGSAIEKIVDRVGVEAGPRFTIFVTGTVYCRARLPCPPILVAHPRSVSLAERPPGDPASECILPRNVETAGRSEACSEEGC
jgi:hypothetical protein